jgi:hypothetical protein
VVEGGSFGFAVATDETGSTVAVGQPDAEDGRGLMYAYNQVALCAYQSYDLPVPTVAELAASGVTQASAPGMMGMMTALSRDGKWLAVAGNLEADSTMAQVYIYRRPSNDSTGGFVFHQKLNLQPAPLGEAGTAARGKVYAGSLSMSREGRLVLVSWSVYGQGLGSESDDPYGAPSTSAPGSAQLYRRNEHGFYGRAQADLVRTAPPYAKTQFFGANSYVVADGNVIGVSTRVIDKNRPSSGSPGVVVYRRTAAGAFELLTTLKTPGSDGTFVMTESGSHMAVIRGSDVHIYVREGDLLSGKTVYNKRCTLVGEDMNLEPSERVGGRVQRQAGQLCSDRKRGLQPGNIPSRCSWLCCTHTHTHARTHARTHAHTHARTHARTQARTHAPKHTYTRRVPARSVHQDGHHRGEQRHAAPGRGQLPGYRVPVERAAGRQARLQGRHLPRDAGPHADWGGRQPVRLGAGHLGERPHPRHRHSRQRQGPRRGRPGGRHCTAKGGAAPACTRADGTVGGGAAVQPKGEPRGPRQQLLHRGASRVGGGGRWGRGGQGDLGCQRPR